jgi:hypothetical protein
MYGKYKTGGMNNPNKKAEVAPKKGMKAGKGAKMTVKKMGKKK